MQRPADIIETVPRVRSLSPVQPERLRGQRRALWRELPAAYKSLLQRRNGALFEDTWLAFHTHVPFLRDGKSCDSQVDAISQLFGFRPDEPANVEVEDLLDVRIQNDAEGFLPSGVIAIGRCLEGSLLCLSTRQEDHGAVYFWDWHWRYPWSKPFFDARIRSVESEFEDIDAIRADPSHPRRAEAIDALNYATIVRLADDLDAWFAECWISSDIDGSYDT